MEAAAEGMSCALAVPVQSYTEKLDKEPPLCQLIPTKH
jgi:hypothetical protein